MYVTRVPNRASPPAVLLRESYREGGKVKNRTLANLSSWPEAKVEALSRALKGLQGAFGISRSLPHGHVAAVLGTVGSLGLDELIDPASSRQRDLVTAMITAAVIDGSSKLATARGLRAETAASSLGEVLGLGSCDEDDLYAAMDWLLPRQEAIEDALAARHLSGGTLVLYDVSSAAFEPLGEIGHARDGVRGRLQIVYGVLTTAEGIPVAVQVFKGSTGDPATLADQVNKLKQRGLPRFEGRSSVRSWLHKIATNACLRAIERRPRRVLPVDYGPAADPHDGLAEPVTEVVWLEPYPDERLGPGSGLASPEARYEQREGVELAFIAALQHLPARQRAVLILRDVLGFSARETAAALDTTPVSVDSALQRAHKTVDERLPEQSQQATLRSLGDGALRQIVQRYVTAWERNDVDMVVAMLAEDGKLAMPPLPAWYRGREQVASFLSGAVLAGATRWRLIPARANGQLAFGAYAWDDKTQTFMPRAVDVLTLRGAQIQEITAFLTPDAFPSFDLPGAIPANS